MVNGQPSSIGQIQQMQSMVGFVPQTDTLLESLTVEENLRWVLPAEPVIRVVLLQVRSAHQTL